MVRITPPSFSLRGRCHGREIKAKAVRSLVVGRKKKIPSTKRVFFVVFLHPSARKERSSEGSPRTSAVRSIATCTHTPYDRRCIFCAATYLPLHRALSAPTIIKIISITRSHLSPPSEYAVKAVVKPASVSRSAPASIACMSRSSSLCSITSDPVEVQARDSRWEVFGDEMYVC